MNQRKLFRIAWLLLTFLLVGSLFAFAGVVYAFGPDTDLSNADASFWGEDGGDYSGYSVASAGDVNGDGLDDFLIAAYGDEDGGGSFAGQTYLILGRAAADWGMDFDLSNANASFWGEDASDYAASVASAGDVNGDGLDDFLIGAGGDEDGGGSNAGQTYLILGRAAADWGMDFDLSNANASFWGEDAGDWSGLSHSVASVGDVNGDGLDDFLIGAYGDDDGGSQAGQAYLILGRAAANWGMDFDLSGADASFLGEDGGDMAGWVGSAGDINSDGLDDFLIGAYGDDDGGSQAGQAYLILGRAAADWAMDFDLSGADASFWGEDAGDYCGYSVASAGDVNGDGRDDFLIGAYNDDDGGTDAGQTYLLLGDGPCVATSTGTGMACFSPSAGAIENLTPVSEGSLPGAAQATKPISFPDGLFSFDITGLSNGQAVNVTITLPPGSAPTQYWKYHASEGGWIQIPMTVVGPPNVIRITLQDGGLGDDDLTVNGVIVDQGGPGGGAVGWDAFAVSKGRVLLPWIVLLVAIMVGASLLAVRRRRAQS